MNYTDTSELISGQSLALFRAFGIQKVSMDAIALKCKLSKKTIYKIFRDKNHLLSEVLQLKSSSLYQDFLQKAAEQENALQELDCFFTAVEQEFSVSSPLFYHDLKKYHSDNYLELLRLKNKLIVDFLLRNIDRGVRESLYKTGETENLIKLYCFHIENLFVSCHSKRSPRENNRLLNTFNQLFKSSLVSVKGYEYINGNSRP